MMNCPTCNVHIDEHEASRCLDAWVATDVMGWTRKKLPPQTDYGPTRRYIWRDAKGEFIKGWYRRDGRLYDLVGNDAWPFSTSIAAAWQVVEKDRGNFRIFDNGIYWVAWYWTLDEVIKGMAKTAPLAICRAAIKARCSKEHIQHKPECWKNQARSYLGVGGKLASCTCGAEEK